MTGAERQKRYRERNAEKVRAALYTYRERNPKKIAEIKRRSMWKHPERRLLQLARERAKKQGLPFLLTINDITIPDVCPALGIPIGITPVRMSDNSPTLDRIDNTLGYVPGNVRVISWRANRVKSNATLADLRLLVAYMEMYLDLNHNDGDVENPRPEG